jgi:hypothetical protein
LPTSDGGLSAEAAIHNEGMNVKQADKRPGNLRTNAMPTDGYVLSVDGKLKTHFGTSAEAAVAASKLKQSFPMIQVAVYDAAERIYTPVGLDENPAGGAVAGEP